MNIKLKDLVDQDGIGREDWFRDLPLITRMKTLKCVLSALENVRDRRLPKQAAFKATTKAIGELISIMLQASSLSASEMKIWSRVCKTLADIEKLW